MAKWQEQQLPLESEPPQLTVQQFSMEALHNVMLQNSSQILALYDEMSVMYGQLDAYMHSGSTLDRSTLLDLYNGGSWSRNFQEQDFIKNADNSLQHVRLYSASIHGFNARKS